jgi:ribosomal protein L11 methylase PrmA
LGCGDGTVLILAAKEIGARGVGIDSDPVEIAKSKRNAQLAGVMNRAQFISSDLFAANIEPATVVALYLLQNVNIQLRAKLLNELNPNP